MELYFSSGLLLAADDSHLRRHLSARVEPSVVVVEKKGHPSSKFSVGCVIHKSLGKIYILTNAELISGSGQLSVHFNDESVATSLKHNNQFAIFSLDDGHMASSCIQFRHEPVDISEALCIVPKPESFRFQKFWGPITCASCASRTDDGTVLPNLHFLYVCHHDNTSLMTPAPVFHRDGRVNGFVVADCEKIKEGSSTDHHVKLCLKATEVEIILQTLLDNRNWMDALDKLLQNW